MPPLLTVHEAAEMLRLSDAAVYSLCKAGLLPHRRPNEGKDAIRINEADVHAFIARLESNRPGDSDLCRVPPAGTGDAKGNPLGEGTAALATHIDSLSERIDSLVERLDRIEELLASLVEREMTREFYSVEEFARIVSKAEFTCREWCRLGRIKATKKNGGRGKHPAWAISHEELLRYRKEGLIPQAR